MQCTASCLYIGVTGEGVCSAERFVSYSDYPSRLSDCNEKDLLRIHLLVKRFGFIVGQLDANLGQLDANLGQLVVLWERSARYYVGLKHNGQLPAYYDS